MPARLFFRGHIIVYILKWIFQDIRELVKGSTRPCAKCGNNLSKEGHDFCLGIIRGVSSACCEHGVKDGYFLFN